MNGTPVDVKSSVEAQLAKRWNNAHRGVPMLKLSDDLDRYRDVIDRTKPDVVIETGTDRGGSCLWFADQGLRVITVDFRQSMGPAIAQLARELGVSVVCGDSSTADTLNVVRLILDGLKPERVMVVLDSDHSVSHVRKEIELYGPLVTSGCFLVVEDTIADFLGNHPMKRWMGRTVATEGGPLRAVESHLVGNPDWVWDSEIEGHRPLSLYPYGWWRRA